MTDYAESITEINRLKREIHDACLAKEWMIARLLANELKHISASLSRYCLSKMREG